MWGWLHIQHIGVYLSGGRGLDRIVKSVYDFLVIPTAKTIYYNEYYNKGYLYSLFAVDETHIIRRDYVQAWHGVGTRDRTMFKKSDTLRLTMPVLPALPLWWVYT